MILSFEEFFLLEQSRANLYHFTSIQNMLGICKEDKLIAKPVIFDLKNPKEKKSVNAICLTRYKGYSETRTDIRICLNTDKLIQDGYKIHPVDEMGMALSSRKVKQFGVYPINYNTYSKANITHPNRTFQNNNNNIPINKSVLEHEYEERIYKDIKDIGKYITYIDLESDLSIRYLQSFIAYSDIIDVLKKYIKKYPHIKVRKMIRSNIKSGISYWKEPTEVLLDINIINSEESQNHAVIRSYKMKKALVI